MYKAKINTKEFDIRFDKKQNISGTISGKSFEFDTFNFTNETFHLLNQHKSYNINILAADISKKNITLKVNGHKYHVQIEDDTDRVLKTLGLQNQSTKKTKDLKAPMPGLVTEILVSKGDVLKKGDHILILEAMKMENNLKVDHDAVVKEIIIGKGNSVEKNQVLVIFE